MTRSGIAAACAVLATSLVACDGVTRSTPAATSTPPQSSVGDEPSEPLDQKSQEMYGLASEALGYRLDVTEVRGRGGQAIALAVTKDGEPLHSIDSAYMHVFAMSPGVGSFTHEPRSNWSSWMNVSNTGRTRVAAVFTDGGDDLVLGNDVDVTEASDFGGGLRNPTQTDLVHASGVVVERDGWDFTMTGSRIQEPLYDYTAWLTVIRQDDLALSYESLDQTGDGVYRFDPVLPGAGDYVAVLEITGAPWFSFYVSIDDEGDFAERPETDVVNAVKAFVGAVDDGAVSHVSSMMSSRCQAILPTSTLEDLAQLVEPGVRQWLTSVVADVNGNSAVVDYVTIRGDYTIGQTPDWRSRRDTWILEGGSWLRDTCEAGYFDW